jgi:hypothetical protein
VERRGCERVERAGGPPSWRGRGHGEEVMGCAQGVRLFGWPACLAYFGGLTVVARLGGKGNRVVDHGERGGCGTSGRCTAADASSRVVGPGRQWRREWPSGGVLCFYHLRLSVTDMWGPAAAIAPCVRAWNVPSPPPCSVAVVFASPKRKKAKRKGRRFAASPSPVAVLCCCARGSFFFHDWTGQMLINRKSRETRP